MKRSFRVWLVLLLALAILTLSGCGKTAVITAPETPSATEQPSVDKQPSDEQPAPDTAPPGDADSPSAEPAFRIDRNGGFSYHTEEMELRSDDGTIHTVLYLPESGAEIYPAVIFSHGFGDTNRGGQAYAQALASQGYLVVCFDFRGGGPSSQSEGSPLDMTVFTEQRDLEAEIEMLRKRDDVDNRYVFLLGNSQGGVVAALTAAAHPDEIRAMALSSPAFSLADDARQRFSSVDEIPAQSFHILMNVGHDYFASIYAFDPIDASKAYSGDVLIFHGDRDELVPIAYSQQAVNAFPHAELEVLHGEGHMYSHDAVQQTVQSISDFFCSHISEANGR